MINHHQYQLLPNRSTCRWSGTIRDRWGSGTIKFRRPSNFSFSSSPRRMTRSKNVQSAEYNGRIDGALEAYKSGHYKSYRAAARAFDVSKTTLMERAKGRTTRNLAREDQQILSAEEEIKLVKWITHLTICGYPPKPYTIKEMAEAIRTRY